MLSGTLMSQIIASITVATIFTSTFGFVSGTVSEGGGIYLGAGSLAVQSSTISGNVALTNAGLSDALGGAIYQAGGSLAVTNSTFAYDAADDQSSSSGLAAGGALYVAAGTATFQNCAFDYDSALGVQGFGGAIYVGPDGSITLSRTMSFLGDTASTAGNSIYFGS